MVGSPMLEASSQSCENFYKISNGRCAALKALLRVASLRKKAMSHKYQPGQLVRLSRGAYLKTGASTGDLYEVTRLMPADQSGEGSYRIKSTGAGERAVCELEITAHFPQD